MTLALIAGEGMLPEILVKRLEADGTEFRFCELEGHPSSARGDRPISRFRVETLGSFIADLKSFGVRDVCFAGRVARPKLDPSAIDEKTMPLVPRMMAALQSGDDAALRLVMGFFEEAGINVKSVQDIEPALMPSNGVLSKVQPTEQDNSDIARGIEIIAAMAFVDIGQACIVSGGQALAVETIGGTDKMMRSLLVATSEISSAGLTSAAWDDPIGLAADWLTGEGMSGGTVRLRRDPDLPEGGLLVKAAKPGQDMRIDVPTVGPSTVQMAAMAGLRGVVVEAGTVLVLDVAGCIEIADAHDMLFWVKK